MLPDLKNKICSSHHVHSYHVLNYAAHGIVALCGRSMLKIPMPCHFLGSERSGKHDEYKWMAITSAEIIR